MKTQELKSHAPAEALAWERERQTYSYEEVSEMCRQRDWTCTLRNYRDWTTIQFADQETGKYAKDPAQAAADYIFVMKPEPLPSYEEWSRLCEEYRRSISAA